MVSVCIRGRCNNRDCRWRANDPTTTQRLTVTERVYSLVYTHKMYPRQYTHRTDHTPVSLHSTNRSQDSSNHLHTPIHHQTTKQPNPTTQSVFGYTTTTTTTTTPPLPATDAIHCHYTYVRSFVLPYRTSKSGREHRPAWADPNQSDTVCFETPPLKRCY